MILTLCLPSHHQLPVHLWTLETRRLSRIPIRHEPAKGQRHSQNPSALSTILPRKATHLTQRLSPLLSHQILVNKLTVFNTYLCVWQLRNRRSDQYRRRKRTTPIWRRRLRLLIGLTQSTTRWTLCESSCHSPPPAR